MALKDHRQGGVSQAVLLPECRKRIKRRLLQWVLYIIRAVPVFSLQDKQAIKGGLPSPNSPSGHKRNLVFTTSQKIWLLMMRYVGGRSSRIKNLKPAAQYLVQGIGRLTPGLLTSAKIEGDAVCSSEQWFRTCRHNLQPRNLARVLLQLSNANSGVRIAAVMPQDRD